MGETGKASRVWSLKEGANLTYGSIGQAHAPGQVDVLKMARAIRELPDLNTPADVQNSFAKL
jgi:3-dehydroquinate dehydratase-1